MLESSFYGLILYDSVFEENHMQSTHFFALNAHGIRWKFTKNFEFINDTKW